MLCSACEIYRFPYLAPKASDNSSAARQVVKQVNCPATTPPATGASDTPADNKNELVKSGKSDEQHVIDKGDRCTKLSSAGAVTTEANARLPNQPSLLQCELLYFMMGCYGQHPDLTIKTTILKFYRDDEILLAKQLLVQAAEHNEECKYNIQPFTKKRTGNNKCKSLVDDIFNIVRVIDEHSFRDKLPTFCAVNRIRVPVIAEELSDMAAVRLELSQLRQLVESLANQLSSASQCKHLNMGPLDEGNPTRCAVDVSEPAVNASANTVVNSPSFEMSSTSTSGNGAETSSSLTATFADHAKVLHKDDFQEVRNRKKDKPPATKRLVIGDSVHDVGFKGIAKKSVFCVNRLERHTTVTAVEDYLRSKNIHVCSCFRVKPRSPTVSHNDDCDDDDESLKFVSMRICIAQYDSEKLLSSDIWPKGITVRPWVFKSKHNA